MSRGSGEPDLGGPETVGRAPGTFLEERGIPLGAAVDDDEVRAENGCREEGP